jgi:hypothetical protein
VKATFGLGLTGIAWCGAGLAALWAVVAYVLGTKHVQLNPRR